MHHSDLYMRLAEGSGEPGEDQRSAPRKAFALLCAVLILVAMPTFAVTSAFADSGPGSDGMGGGDCATREDNSGPGSCDDDDEDEDDEIPDIDAEPDDVVEPPALPKSPPGAEAEPVPGTPEDLPERS